TAASSTPARADSGATSSTTRAWPATGPALRPSPSPTSSSGRTTDRSSNRASSLFFTDDEFVVIQAACARLIPSGEGPDATEAGVADYIDGLLGAFAVDPPRIWA